MSTLACLGYYCMYKGAWETFLFLFGIILAEMRHIREETKFRLEHLFKDEKHVRYARRAISGYHFHMTDEYSTDAPQIHFGS